MHLALLLSLFTLLNGAYRINGGESPDLNPWSNCQMENWQLKLATGGNGLIANECAWDGEFKSWNALRITEFDGHVTMESSSFIIELNDTFRFIKEPKHLNISGAFSNVAAALGEDFHQAISWGAWTEGYEFATRIIAMEIHSAIANDDGTKRCKKKCALLATALPVQHYGIKCTQIVFPADIAQMTLNVLISSPYEEACKKYEIQRDIINMTFGDVKEQEKVDACNKVSTKCEKPHELFVCFKSRILNKNVSDANLMIFQKCRDHFGNDFDATAGFRVHICTRRNADQLIIESMVDFSFTDRIYKRTDNFSITFGAMSNMNGMAPIFFMEFGDRHQQSAIRQNEDGEPISDDVIL
uniref:Venom protein n=1 Tax=Globodera pallida TaxID=36090 RepID=A0A183BXF0_GLOPA